MKVSTSVPIVGGSLNGLTMAMLLARCRARCLVLERHPQTAVQYKVRAIFPGSMKIYRSAGIETEIRDGHLIDDRSASVARMTNLADSAPCESGRWRESTPDDTLERRSITGAVGAGEHVP